MLAECYASFVLIIRLDHIAVLIKRRSAEVVGGNSAVSSIHHPPSSYALLCTFPPTRPPFQKSALLIRILFDSRDYMRSPRYFPVPIFVN
jgi:hypothetical protein